jgi:FkbM family methyltransferase
MTDWDFIYRKYQRKIGFFIVGGQRAYGYRWGAETNLGAAGTEDFNDPTILEDHDGDFIDGGAAYGFWTVRAAKHYRKVIAIEPDPFHLKQLWQNVKLNRLWNVDVLPGGIGAENGAMQFDTSIKSFLPEVMGLKGGKDGITVPLWTIDMITEKFSLRPSVIKLDVEGAESEALQGARRTLAEYKPTLIVEVHYPRSIEDVQKVVEGYSWNVRWRFLNSKVYPYEKQPHLLGTPNDVQKT